MISLIWTASLLAPLPINLPSIQAVVPVSVGGVRSRSRGRVEQVPPLPVEPIFKQRRPSQKHPGRSRIASPTIFSFNNTNGAYPLAEVIQVGGFLYGTTYQGGTKGEGTIFSLAPTTKVIKFQSFESSSRQGANPTARLTPDGDGNLYSTTYLGGIKNVGTIFKIRPNPSNQQPPKPILVRSFIQTNGAFPFAGVNFDDRGTLYGTTVGGGTNGFGTVFQLSGSALTARHSFKNNDGARPYGGVILDRGNLYGTTYIGGTNALGTIFRFPLTTALRPLYNFKRSDGFYSYGSLVPDRDGNLYGTTCNGGVSGNGTVFKLSTSRNLTKYSFKGSDGSCPTAGVTLDTKGNLYGTTYNGGVRDKGTVFKLNNTLTRLTPLYSFTGTGTDGANPEAGVILDGSTLYGTTRLGGSGNYGTVYKLTIPDSALRSKR